MSSSSDEDRPDPRPSYTLPFEEFVQRYTGRIRRDGKPFHRGNIQYAYNAKRGFPKKRRAPRGEADGGPLERRSRIEEDEPTEEVAPPPLEPIHEESTIDIDMADTSVAGPSGIQQQRTRRDAPSGASGTPETPSATASNVGISYIQAQRASVGHFAFEHTHLMNTWGNAYKIATPGTVLETKAMITSLACVPVTLLSFWMTYAEYRNLPPATRIVSVECIVIPKGFKTSFDTGTSITSSANNTQGVFAQVAVGLNRHLLIRNYEVERNPAKPMEISNFKIPVTDHVSERLWGYAKFDAVNFDKSIPACVGIPRSLKIYAAFLMPYKSSEHKDKALTTGWPDLMKYIRTFNFLNHIETPCIHYSYRVKTNMLKPKTVQHILDDAAHHKTFMGGEDISLYTGQLDSGGFSITRLGKLKPVPESKGDYNTYLTENIEHACTVTIPDHTPPNSGHPQPSLHIGILPVQSNAPDKEPQEYVTSCATWELKTRIHLVTDHHELYTHNSIYPANKVPFGIKPTGFGPAYNNTVFGFQPSGT